MPRGDDLRRSPWGSRVCDINLARHNRASFTRHVRLGTIPSLTYAICTIVMDRRLDEVPFIVHLIVMGGLSHSWTPLYKGVHSRLVTVDILLTVLYETSQ